MNFILIKTLDISILNSKIKFFFKLKQRINVIEFW